MNWSRSTNEVDSERMAVVVSRHWNNPDISVTVNRDKIELVCKLDDFVEALTREMGSPMFSFSMKSQKDRARRAMLAAVEKIKEASSKVM